MWTLADLAEGDETIVHRVFEEDEQLLKFFWDEGVLPGQPVRLEVIAPYRGTVTVTIGDRQVVIGTQVARFIWVKPPAGQTAAVPGSQKSRRPARRRD